MITSVKKRSGYEEPFDPEKITRAIEKAAQSIESDNIETQKITNNVVKKLNKTFVSESPTVDEVHTQVENELMNRKLFDLAREYISYRDRHRPDIFRERSNVRPYEYPQLMKYVDAIQHSYWLFSEYNYNSDVQDIRVNMTEEELSVAKRAMLAISHIEDRVKTFWSRVDMHMPKSEIAQVGAVFGESEQRHQALYSHLIDICGFTDEFKNLDEVPCIKNRMEYIKKATAYSSSDDPKEYFEALILFSMIIENVSLFSQFFILMSFSRHKNMLTGMKNGIDASSKEERLHAAFGSDLVNIIKKENPDWWNDDIKNRVRLIMEEAYESENKILDWIYEKGDLSFIPKHHVVEYMKSRFNESLTSIGMDKMFEPDERILDECEWFSDNAVLTANTDFFADRSVSYTKRSKPVTEDDLF